MKKVRLIKKKDKKQQYTKKSFYVVNKNVDLDSGVYSVLPPETTETIKNFK